MRDGKPERQDEQQSMVLAANVRLQRTTSRALLGDSRELIIEHHGREYRLRVTQQGKLILTA